MPAGPRARATVCPATLPLSAPTCSQGMQNGEQRLLVCRSSWRHTPVWCQQRAPSALAAFNGAEQSCPRRRHFSCASNVRVVSSAHAVQAQSLFSLGRRLRRRLAGDELLEVRLELGFATCHLRGEGCAMAGGGAAGHVHAWQRCWRRVPRGVLFSFPPPPPRAARTSALCFTSAPWRVAAVNAQMAAVTAPSPAKVEVAGASAAVAGARVALARARASRRAAAHRRQWRFRETAAA